MTPPRTMLGTATSWGPLARPWTRRGLFAAVMAVLALLSVVPRRHVATVQLSQPSGGAAGLGALLGQLGGAASSYASLLGGGQSYETNLAVGRSFAVETEVLRRARLLGTPDYETIDAAVRTLRRHVEIASMRGAIIEIDVDSHDPDYAMRIAQIYADVFRARLTALGREQTAYKRRVLEDRLGIVATRLSRAQGAVDRFRATNALPDPLGQLAASVGSLSALEAQLQAERAKLEAALHFATPSSFEVQRIQANVVALERQIAIARRNRGGTTAAGLAAKSNRFADLQRDLQYAQTLYLAYTRYLEGAAVENESAEWTIQALQPAYLRPGIHPNRIPFGLLILVALALVACEAYLFAPRRIRVREAAVPPS